MHDIKDFYNGVRCYKNNELDIAEYYFTNAIEASSYRLLALEYLILINMKKGRFDKARNIINSNKEPKNALYLIKSELELSEQNYYRAFYYVNNYLNDDEKSFRAKIDKVHILEQLGDFTEANNIIQSINLEKDKYSKYNLLLEEIYIKLYSQKYKNALKLFKNINFKLIPDEYLSRYENTMIQLLYVLNKLKDISNYHNDYLYKRLVNKDNTILINHIKKHIIPEFNMGYAYFLDNVNLDDLINTVNKKIHSLPGEFMGPNKRYIISMDHPIGKILDEYTNNICVIATCVSNDIITMFPVFLSEDFNKENLEEEIILKRKNYQ